MSSGVLKPNHLTGFVILCHISLTLLFVLFNMSSINAPGWIIDQSIRCVWGGGVGGEGCEGVGGGKLPCCLEMGPKWWVSKSAPPQN